MRKWIYPIREYKEESFVMTGCERRSAGKAVRMKNTKEAILDTALHLFARDGYEAVSVSQIAGSLGMTKGALYRHYKNKHDIFLHIVRRMEQRDVEQAGDHGMPEESSEKMPEQYRDVSAETLMDYSKTMFEYWTEDDFASSFRRMLILEQFRSEEMQALYQQYLVSGPAGYVKDLFEAAGIPGAEEKAVRFYSNMFFFYSVYDGAEDKKEAKRRFEHMAAEILKDIG